MPIIQQTISEYGYEQDFISALYDVFLEIKGVTLTPTKENLGNLFINDEAYTFSVEYNGIQINFTRVSKLLTPAGGLYISIAGTSIPQTTWVWGVASAYNYLYTRTAKVTLIISDSAVEMVFATNGQDYFSSSNTYYYLFLPFEADGVNTYLYKGNSTKISTLTDQPLYKLNDTPAYKLARNFNFTVPNNGIKLLNFSSLQMIDTANPETTTSASSWVADMQGVCNCSTVPVNNKLTINNKDYFSIGADVIVEI